MKSQTKWWLFVINLLPLVSVLPSMYYCARGMGVAYGRGLAGLRAASVFFETMELWIIVSGCVTLLVMIVDMSIIVVRRDISRSRRRVWAVMLIIGNGMAMPFFWYDVVYQKHGKPRERPIVSNGRQGSANTLGATGEQSESGLNRRAKIWIAIGVYLALLMGLMFMLSKMN